MSLKDINNIIWLLLPPVFIILGCAITLPPPCTKDGKDYSRVDKMVYYDWDSCYRRGCSYLNGECPYFAINEFKKAIGEKPNDERLTRSYGMHFLGYFPHRELGIAYYITGQTRDAIKELEKSIADSPSSKAEYFLNEARKAWLKENDLDHEPPWLNITKPSSIPYLTNKLKFRVEGEAVDDQFVSALIIGEEPIFIELSGEIIPFAHTVSLKPGLNEIIIMARDLLDKNTEKRLQIVVDRTGPLINLSHSLLADAYKEGHIWMLGVVYDESGIEVLTINQKPIGLQPIEIENGEYAEAFCSIFDIPKDQKMISLSVKDMAGNVTEASIELSPTTSSRRMLTLWPNYENDGKVASHFNNQNEIRIASLDPFIPSSFVRIEDKYSFDDPYYETDEYLSEPFLFIDEKNLPNTTTYDEIYIVGKVQYQVPISGIQILLNKELIVSKRPKLSLSIKMKQRIIRKLYEFSKINKILNKLKQTEEDNLVFSEIIRLNPGPNKITVKVTNEKGVSRYQAFDVFKKKEEVLDQKYRLCFSVLPVEDLSEFKWRSPFKEKYVFRRLDSAFVEQNRFQVVEREKLEKILIEYKINASKLSSKKQVIQTGRLLNAEIIFTSFMRLDKDSIELNGTTIDIETSRKLFHKDIYLEDKYFNDKDEMILRAIEILAMKVRDSFPLCKGIILEKKGANIIVNIGKQQKIGDHTKLVVYRKDDFGTKFLSEARIKETIDETSSNAVLLDEKKQKEVTLDDLVITK